MKILITDTLASTFVCWSLKPFGLAQKLKLKGFFCFVFVFFQLKQPLLLSNPIYNSNEPKTAETEWMYNVHLLCTSHILLYYLIDLLQVWNVKKYVLCAWKCNNTETNRQQWYPLFQR